MTTRNRWFLMFAGLLSFVLILGAACGSDDDDDAETPTGGDTPSAGGGQAPADQQKITIQFAEPQFYDPHRSNFEQDIGIERMLFRGLYNLTDDGDGGVEVVNAMADGEPTVNGNVYTVTLGDHKWSDGEPVTAANFVYGITRACDPAVASPYAYLLGAGLGELKGCDDLAANEDPAQTETLKAALGVRAVDDKTLEITLNKPVPTFTTIFSLWPTFPAREDVITEHGDAWTDPANIVVNGPFTLKSLTLKDNAVLTPNPEWDGQKPALQEITVKFIDDLSAAFRQYQTDELDITEILATDVVVAEGDSALADSLLVSPTARITALEAQLSNEALANFDLRLAISRSINREQLIDVVYDGVGEPATYWVVKGVDGHQGNEAFDDIIGYNPDEAKAALQRYLDAGNTLPELRLTVRDTPQRRNEVDFLAKAFQDTLGLTIIPEFVDSPTRSARFNSGDFDLFPGGWQLDYPDIENPLVGLFDTGGGNNKYNCSDPDIDAAFAAAASATSDEARIEAYMEAETLIVTRLCGVIPMYQDSRPYLVDTKIGGIVENGTIDAGLPGTYCVECWFVKAE